MRVCLWGREKPENEHNEAYLPNQVFSSVLCIKKKDTWERKVYINSFMMMIAGGQVLSDSSPTTTKNIIIHEEPGARWCFNVFLGQLSLYSLAHLKHLRKQVQSRILEGSEIRNCSISTNNLHEIHAVKNSFWTSLPATVLSSSLCNILLLCSQKTV